MVLGFPEAEPKAFFAGVLVPSSVLRMPAPGQALGGGRFDGIDDGIFRTIAVSRKRCEQKSENGAAFDGRSHKV